MARKRTYKILLSDEDKKILNATIHNKKTCKMTIQRCQILLELDENAPKHLTQMQIAKTFGVSKATVHKDVTQRLIQINPRLAFQTRIILDINKSERHIRGGMATREKYRHHTQDVTFSSNIHAPCGNTEYSDTHSKDSEFPQVHRRTPPDRRHHFDSRLHSSLEFDPATDFYGMSDIHRAVIQQSPTAENSGNSR